MIPIFSDLTLGYDLLFAGYSTIASNTTTDSSAIDLQSYDGPVHIMAIVGNYGDATTQTVISMVQADTTGGSYTATTAGTQTLSGSATANDNTAYIIKVDCWSKRFVKVRVVTTAGGAISVPIALAVLARKKIGGGSGVLTAES